MSETTGLKGKAKPVDAQCTDCSVDQPYPETVRAGGVICGGCGRSKPNVRYHLLADAEAVMSETNELEGKAFIAKGYEHYGILIRLADATAAVEAARAEGDTALENARIVALQNCRLLASRENHKAPSKAWGHILRFCAEAGIKSSILRDDASRPDPSLDVAQLVAEARKLAIGYDVLNRLAGNAPASRPNIIGRLIAALEPLAALRAENEQLKESYKPWWKRTELPVMDAVVINAENRYVTMTQGAADAVVARVNELEQQLVALQSRLGEARIRFQWIKDHVCGKAIPNWRDPMTATVSRGKIADVCDAALSHLDMEGGGESDGDTNREGR